MGVSLFFGNPSLEVGLTIFGVGLVSDPTFFFQGLEALGALNLEGPSIQLQSMPRKELSFKWRWVALGGCGWFWVGGLEVVGCF